MDDQRAERALRAALDHDELPPTPGPQAVRRQVRDRRVALGSIAAGVALVVAAIGFGVVDPRGADTLVAGPSQAPSAAPTAPTPTVPSAGDPAPGWRHEYFRAVRFQVPQAWGHQFAPGSDWCADSADGQPAERHRAPYVALGEPAFVRTIGCRPQPSSLLTEHAQIRDLGAAEDYGSARGLRSQAGWWIGYRLLEGQVLAATSHDRDRVEQILDSAEVAVDPPCPVELDDDDRRPPDPWSVADAGAVGAITVCQYDAIEEDRRRSLRAVTQLDPENSQRVIDAVADTPIRRSQPCETPTTYDLILLLQVPTDGQLRRLDLAAGLCGDGRTPLGGFDDGSDIRLLTPAACRPLIVPPVVLAGGGAYVMDACGG